MEARAAARDRRGVCARPGGCSRAGSVQVYVGAGREVPWRRGQLPAQAASRVAADLVLWRRPWASGFVLVMGVEMPDEP